MAVDPEQRPEPLTPPDCNLRDFPDMFVAVRRFLTSDTWVMGTDAEKAAMVPLWFESWHQQPAASLPDDERVLAHLSQSKSWKKVREQAMRNWILCRDGRYYHPIVAEKALEAWIGLLLSQAAGGSTNAKRWGADFDGPSMLARLQDAIARLEKVCPQSKLLRKAAVQKAKQGTLPGSPPDHPKGSPPDRNKGSPPDSPPDQKTVAIEKEKEKEILKNTLPPSPPPPAPPAPPPPPPASAKRKRSSGKAVDPEPDEPLDGVEQRSRRPLKSVPKSFAVTEDMVLWANRELPILGTEDLKAEHRKFRAHRYATGRVVWVDCWKAWMTTAAQYKADRARPAAGGSYTTARHNEVASAVPGLVRRTSPLPRTIEANHARTLDTDEPPSLPFVFDTD